MKTKHISDLLVLVLIFASFPHRVVACCEGSPPGNPDCYECEDGVWVLKSWAGCGKDSDCTGECHDGCYLCTCSNDDSKCNAANCETCVDGSCKVCDGDPNKSCCEGSCCDKVWTKETHTAIDESCPTVADCAELGCDGIKVTDQQSYDSCLNVGVGEGEHCECNEEEQVVGKKYTCEEDWDWSMMATCAFEAAICFFQCVGAYADPASCSDCLGMLQLECCGGDTCHICDFLESCDPLYPEDIKKPVFINFGNCQ